MLGDERRKIVKAARKSNILELFLKWPFATIALAKEEVKDPKIAVRVFEYTITHNEQTPGKYKKGIK